MTGARQRGGLRLLALAVWAGLLVAQAPAVTAAVTVDPVPAPRSHPGAGSPVPVGLARLASAAGSPGERLEAIATFGGRRPTEGQRLALVGLGLQVQVMRHLPLALVRGSLSQLEAGVGGGIATDFYPDERLLYFSTTSTRSIGSDGLRVEGVTGRGVGVAIVDTGIDGTQPDLADHVTHNVKIVGPEYAARPPDEPPGSIAVPVDQGPYNNSDLSSGHGTHVAGIVAADAHTSPDQVGVAPDADLIGYAVGDAGRMSSMVAAFDDILEHRLDWGIRVVNNSWGASYRLFDPDDPINTATRALHDAGLVVVFSAGNNTDEMQLNPYSAAPWVISVASGTVDKRHSDFSSGGVEFDNSVLSKLPADGHLHFQGDRIGLYHPDVTAPGTDIVSSGTPAGVQNRPACEGLPPGGPSCTATASGTSMAAPHVAGVAALLLQVRPELTPGEVRQVIQVTATPMNEGAPFWQAGYGFVDAASAVALVRRFDFGPEVLARLSEKADARVQADRSFGVHSADFWTFPAFAVATPRTDFREYVFGVTPETTALKGVVAFPAYGSEEKLNQFEYKLTLKDANGTVVARSDPSLASGSAVLRLDLRTLPSVAYGNWTLQVVGIVDVSWDEPVTVSLAQLRQ